MLILPSDMALPDRPTSSARAGRRVHRQSILRLSQAWRCSASGCRASWLPRSRPAPGLPGSLGARSRSSRGLGVVAAAPSLAHDDDIATAADDGGLVPPVAFGQRIGDRDLEATRGASPGPAERVLTSLRRPPCGLAFSTATFRRTSRPSGCSRFYRCTISVKHSTPVAARRLEGAALALEPGGPRTHCRPAPARPP